MVEQGLSQNTIGQRLAFVDRRLREWGTLNVAPRVLAQWLEQSDGWTRVTYFNNALSVYTYLLEVGRIERNPLGRMRRPPRPRPQPKPLPEHQVALLLDASSGDMRAWLVMAYLAGLRAHEIAKVRGEHVNFAAIRVVGKGGHAASLPTHTGLWELAQEYPSTGWWFPDERAASGHISGNAISQRIGRYFRSMGVTERGAIHRLRHSYCTQLSRNGVSARVIQELMRHASLETTQMYIEVASEEKRRAVETLQIAMPRAA